MNLLDGLYAEPLPGGQDAKVFHRLCNRRVIIEKRSFVVLVRFSFLLFVCGVFASPFQIFFSPSDLSGVEACSSCVTYQRVPNGPFHGLEKEKQMA